MKVILKTCFFVVLASTFVLGVGTFTADDVEARILIAPDTCPSLSGWPDSSDTFLGSCDHPCGGMCDLYRDGATGNKFYDVACPLQ